MGNRVADGVVDKSSTKFDAKIQAVRHVAETMERVFSRMLELVILGIGLVYRIVFSMFRLVNCRQ